RPVAHLPTRCSKPPTRPWCPPPAARPNPGRPRRAPLSRRPAPPPARPPPPRPPAPPNGAMPAGGVGLTPTCDQLVAIHGQLEAEAGQTLVAALGPRAPEACRRLGRYAT